MLLSSSQQPLPSPSYTLQILEARHRFQVVKFCGRQFGRQYPLTVAYCKYDPKTNAEQVQIEFWESVVDQFIKSGMSVVAVDQKKQEIVGLLLALDYTRYQELNISSSEEDFYGQALEELKNDLLNKLDVSLLHELNTPGTCVQFFGLAVAPSHSGKGIMKAIMSKVISLVVDQKCKYAFMHPTSAISEHLCVKFDFKLLACTRSDLFELKGRKPFEFVEVQHRRATIYIKNVQK